MSRVAAQDQFHHGPGIGVQDEAGTGKADHDEADLIVSLLATGLLQAHQRVFYGAPLSVPYPAALQRGLDRLTLLAIRSGVPAPAGVPDLVRWCHEPVRSWPVPLGGEALAGEVLMDLGVPTRACHEWAVDAVDVESEVFENEVIADVRQVCQAAGRQDSYVAFRHLVISAPVLTELEFQQKLMDPVLNVVATMLKQCYPAAPLECQHDDLVTCCEDCGNLLVGSADGLTCVDDRCPRKGRARRGQALPVVGGVRWLAGPVRAFVASPGRAELRLRDAVLRQGAEVELWPNFDAYDLRIVLPRGGAWAVDVKDWSNPVRLARRLKRLPREPSWDRSFIVPAREAVTAWPGYLATLRARSRGLCRGADMAIVSEQQLIAKVRKEIERTVYA